MATTKQHRASREMLYLVELYRQQHQSDDSDEIDLAVVAHWAIANNHWQRPPADPEAILRRELARAMRNDYIADPQGREVRKFHPVVQYEGEHKTSIWQEITTARPAHMQVSLQQRRQAILERCLQHKLDFDSYNDNNLYKASLPPSTYNFDPDIEESGFPGTYSDDPDDPEGNE